LLTLFRCRPQRYADEERHAATPPMPAMSYSAALRFAITPLRRQR